jgi:hypothetical protein
MKKVLITALMLSCLPAMSNVLEGKLECEILLKPAGVYYTYCPRGTLMDANGTRVSHVGGSIFVTDQVRCVTPVVSCQQVAKVPETQATLEEE